LVGRIAGVRDVPLSIFFEDVVTLRPSFLSEQSHPRWDGLLGACVMHGELARREGSGRRGATADVEGLVDWGPVRSLPRVGIN
jgi:hypothetical protein